MTEPEALQKGSPMRSCPSRRAVPTLAMLVLVISACGSSSKPKQAAGTTTTTTAPSITGALNVFAAASLTGSFNSAKTTLASAHPGLNLTYNFAGSNTLVAQIQQGAPADVFASADTKKSLRRTPCRHRGRTAHPRG